MAVRRWKGSGKFRRAHPQEDFPLMKAAVLAKSEPHVRGAKTREARWKAKRRARTEALRFEVAMRTGWLI